MIKCTCCGTTSDNLEDNVAMIALSPPGSENRKWACTKCLSTYPDLTRKVHKIKFTVIKRQVLNEKKKETAFEIQKES